MDAIAYDSRLSEQTTGRLAIPEHRFEKVLGVSAYLTWQILCAHRDAEGITTITIRGMRRAKRFETLNAVQIKRALVRLRTAGLVRDLVRRRIRMQRPVGRCGKTAEVWAFPRRVYGARAISMVGSSVLVPGWVWRWLKVAPYRGGARENAGRKLNPRANLPEGSAEQEIIANRVRQSVRSAVIQYERTGYLRRSQTGFPNYAGIIKQLGPCPGSHRKYHIDHIRPLATFNLMEPEQLRQAFAPANHQWLSASDNLKKNCRWDGATNPGAHAPGPKIYPQRVLRSIQTVPCADSSNCTPDIYKRSVERGSYGGDVASRASLGMPHGVASNAAAPPLLMAKHPAGVGSKIEIGGGGRPPPPPGTMGVPPYPGPRVCPPALIPGPPKLPDHVQNVEAAEWLAKAFRGAVESRYKKRCWVLAGRGKLEKSKYLMLLIEAADLLREYGVPPAAWAAFSVDQWRRNQMGKGQPRLNWTYGLKRIEDQHGWGRREGYASRRAVYSKPAQELMMRYKRMRAALAQAGAQTRQEVTAVVERWFPGDLYEDLGRRARERAADDQRLINARAARGEWLGW